MNIEQPKDAELSGQFRRSSFGRPTCPGMPYCTGVRPVHPSNGFLRGKVKVKLCLHSKVKVKIFLRGKVNLLK